MPRLKLNYFFRALRFWASVFFCAATLTSCRDYFNRTYHYKEEVPVKPFVFQVLKSEYRMQGDEGTVKFSVQVQNKSHDPHTLIKDVFSLRTEKSELRHNKDLREKFMQESILFKGSEEAVVTLEFTVPREAFSQRFDLILDRSERKGAPGLTLVSVKDQAPPQSLGTEWQVAESTHWK
jgi:hypothetical protein